MRIGRYMRTWVRRGVLIDKIVVGYQMQRKAYCVLETRERQVIRLN